MPKRSRVDNTLLIAIIFALATAGCVTIYNPATEQKETLLIDTASEVTIGNSLAEQIRAQMTMLPDARMQERLALIGGRIAAVSDRRDLTYTFEIVKDDTLNAFAIPGGHVFVHSGLMKRANDNELACVLAHEVGHVAARHSVKRLQATLGYQLVAGLVLGTGNQQTLQKAMNVIFNLISLGYSRQDELLADKLSLRYSSRAGYDPRGLVSFFRKLEDETKGARKTPVYLSSHPDMQDRIANAENEIMRLGAGGG